MLRSPLLASLPGLAHGLTTRDEGSVGPLDDPRARAVRRAAVESLGGGAVLPTSPRQVHGAHVALVTEAGGAVGDADAVVTTRRGVPLMVQGADCPLLAVVAPEGPALALVHSGWRGTVARIAARAVEALAGEGIAPASAYAAVFPGIGSCCFEVGPEVIAAFGQAFGAQSGRWSRAGDRPGHALLDLPAALRTTLAEAGLREDHVDVVPGCTACGGNLWSHRASGGGPERHGLFAMLTDASRQRTGRAFSRSSGS